jgi:hypothetical protein
MEVEMNEGRSHRGILARTIHEFLLRQPIFSLSLFDDCMYTCVGFACEQPRWAAADPRFTFHTSRFTVPGSKTRTKLAGFF